MIITKKPYMNHEIMIFRGVGGEHDLSLVLFSYIVVLLACFAALMMAESVRHSLSSKRAVGWLGLGALIFGAGAWSMHCVGMLAYRLPFPVSHDPVMMAFSMLPAVLGGGYAVYVISGRGHVWRDLLAGIVLGLAMGAMHYTGMLAMKMPAHLHYHPAIFVLSLFVAIVFSVAAIQVRRLVAGGVFAPGFRWRLLLVSALMALAIFGMHHTAMMAVKVIPHEAALPLDSGFSDRSEWLATALGGSTLLVVMASLLAVTFDHHLRHNQRLLNMSGERLLEVISAISDGVALFDERGCIQLCNAALCRVTGISHDRLRRMQLSELGFVAVDGGSIEEALDGLIKGGRWTGEMTRPVGPCRFTRVEMIPVRYSQGYERHFVATFADITEQREREQQVHHLAFHDSLTGLPNRVHLHQQLQALCDRGGDALLMLLDISRFKVLNDTLGYEMGDLLLTRAAARLRRQGVSGSGLARVDGNEFAVVIDRLPQPEWIDSLMAEMSWPYDLDGYLHDCSFCVGMARLEEGVAAAAEWMTRAGLALSHAKREGAACARWFEPEMERAVHERVLLEAELREALASGGSQLCLHFQPQVDRAGRMIGVEALVRWQHPDRGLVSPGLFVPLAEETGQIHALGSWVLREGCRQLAAWSRIPEMARIRLSINVSVRQFQQPAFVDEVIAVLAETGAPTGQLTLELTESLLMEQVDSAIESMQRLRAIGVRFSLDDFGTGYSSLGYLSRFPFDTLKIDGSFVRDVVNNAGSAAIIRTIIALANSLGLVVVAEGIETSEQRDFLLSCGCRCYQGYFFGRPVPASELPLTLDGVDPR